MIVLGIDPGNELSAYVFYDTVGKRVGDRGKIPNEALRLYLVGNRGTADVLAIEMAESFGAKVWDQVFKTTFWGGRLVEAWGRAHALVYRREVKMHICGVARAKDPQIRNTLLERWGGKDIAIGTKKNPGPLYGVTADIWQALALAVTYAEGGTRAQQAARSVVEEIPLRPSARLG